MANSKFNFKEINETQSGQGFFRNEDGEVLYFHQYATGYFAGKCEITGSSYANRGEHDIEAQAIEIMRETVTNGIEII